VNTRSSWYALALASTAAIGAVAHADLIVTYDGVGSGLRQDVSYTNQSWDQTTGEEFFYNVGAFERLWTTESGDSVITWCIEIFQGISVGQVVDFDIVDTADAPSGPGNPGPMGEAQAQVLEDVFARWIDPATGGIQTGGTAGGSDSRAAAFQLVVWEITHENFTATDRDGVLAQISLASGGLQANLTDDGGDGVAFWVDQIIASIGADGWLESDLLGLVDPQAQDQVILVPAPGALALLGLGSFAAVRRRRRA
jgi:hypothetical protein